MPDAIALITERVHKRAAKYHTFIQDVLPPLEVVAEPCYFGSFSIATDVTKRRFLRKDSLISIDHSQDTPTALARDYLMSIYKHGPRMRAAQIESVVRETAAAPRFATPGRFAFGQYIDIESAFFSIMQVAGWNCDYYPGVWFGQGRPPHDFPWPSNKTARNAMVFLTHGTEIPHYDPRGGRQTVTKKNPLLNRGLFCLINDVLNALACIAIEHNARYINTDGYIFTSVSDAAAMIQAVADFGLRARLKHEGPGIITTEGGYAIGYSRPRIAHEMPEPDASQCLDNVKRVPYRRWLADRFSRFAAVSGPLTPS